MSCQSSSGPPSGPFTTASACVQLFHQFWSLPTISSRFHLTHVSSLSGRAAPVSDGLYASPQSRRSRFPLAFRPVGICFLDHPVPAATSASLTVRLLHADHNGVSTFRTIKLRLGRVPPLPRDRWCPASRYSSREVTWRFPTPGPVGQLSIPSSDRLRSRGIAGGSLEFTRPVFPSPVVSGWFGKTLGLTVRLHTPPLPATHADLGTDHGN